MTLWEGVKIMARNIRTPDAPQPGWGVFDTAEQAISKDGLISVGRLKVNGRPRVALFVEAEGRACYRFKDPAAIRSLIGDLTEALEELEGANR